MSNPQKEAFMMRVAFIALLVGILALLLPLVWPH